MYTAIILAAGESDRMGKLKQLLEWNDKTILETVIENVLSSKYIDDQVRVVLGAKAEKIKKKLNYFNDPRLKIIKNPDYKQGMSSSIKKGVENLPSDTKYLVIFLGDQPLITADIFDNIIEKFQSTSSEIMQPIFENNPGHPVIISTNYLPEIQKLKGPMGLKPFIKRHNDIVNHFTVENEKVIIDLDYYDDYLYYKNKYN